MNDTQKILKALADISDVQDLIETQGMQLNHKMDTLTKRMDTLELKTEAFHDEQRRANGEIMEHLLTSTEANGEAHKELVKEVDRIKKHLNLPPVK
jgi:outer membrane murein-binding lipoprotein Lpp